MFISYNYRNDAAFILEEEQQQQQQQDNPSEEDRSRNSSCTSLESMTKSKCSAQADNISPVGPTDRTPLVGASRSNVSAEGLKVLTVLLVSSLVITLGGLNLLFFYDDALEVLWLSILLVCIGSTLTVITVLPGSGEFIVLKWRKLKAWRQSPCCEPLRITRGVVARYHHHHEQEETRRDV